MDALTAAIDFNRGLAALAGDEEVRLWFFGWLIGWLLSRVWPMSTGRGGWSVDAHASPVGGGPEPRGMAQCRFLWR